MKHVLPELKYPYDALEAYIDKTTMEIHYSKHHAAYVNNLNNALEGNPKLMEMDLEVLLQSLDQVPENLYWMIRNNGGGHYNHTLFWDIIGPNGGGEPKGALLDAISEAFGSFDNFKARFAEAATKQFGSGWAWLIINDDNKLEVVATPNQDNPMMEGKSILLGLDVWEHAYYLKYQNKRPDYINAWWNVINWDAVAKRYDNLK